jgi:hypothetical protein
VYGGHHILAHLRALGFQTFHPWIDESYDREPDDIKRFQMFLKAIDTICGMEPNQIKQCYEKLIPIVRHNREHLRKKERAGHLQDRLRQAGILPSARYQDIL